MLLFHPLSNEHTEDVSVDSDDEGIVSSGLKAPQSDLDIPLCKPAGPLSPPVKLQASLPLSTQLERDGHRTWRSESLFDTDESDGDLFPLDPDKGSVCAIQMCGSTPTILSSMQ